MGQHEDVSALVAAGDNLADSLSLETFWDSQQEGGHDRANNRCSYAYIQYGVSKRGRLNQVTFDLTITIK